MTGSDNGNMIHHYIRTVAAQSELVCNVLAVNLIAEEIVVVHTVGVASTMIALDRVNMESCPSVGAIEILVV